MSHDIHGDPHGQVSPEALGTGTITMGVKLLVALGVCASIMQGLFVGLSSGYGRVWPSENSAKVDLPPSNF